MVRHISLKTLLAGFLLAGIFSSCSDEVLPNNDLESIDGSTSLQIVPSVFGISDGQTRATETPEVAKTGNNYNESVINTMDVYILDYDSDNSVYKVLIAKRFSGEIDNTGATAYEIVNDCRKAGIKNNTDYRVYVSVNSQLEDDDVENMIGKTEAYIKAINTQDANVFKRYGTQAEYNAMPTYGVNPIDTEKSFLMDYVTTWNSGSGASKIIQMTSEDGLKRAAAKIVLNVTFSEDFKETLENINGDSQHSYTVDGRPLVRYVNFGFNTTDFRNGIYDETIGQDIQTGSLFNVTDIDSDGKTGSYSNTYYKYGLTTYSFHTEWTAANKAEGAPYIMISIGYKRDDKPKADYNYYRIPVCGDITSLDRNNLYIVNAEITSFGSTTDSDDMESVNLTYQVVEWKNYTPAEIEALEFRYLKVNPTTQYLYGNGEQKVDLNYYVNSGDKVIFDQLVVTYKNASGGTNTVTGQNIADYITDNGDGTFTVKSTSLANHAVKDFTFRVRLANSSGSAYSGAEARSVTVTMRHFPTDNIQNIEGAWSSREDYSFTTYSYSNFSTTKGNRNSQKTGYWRNGYGYGNSYNVENDQNNSPGLGWSWQTGTIYYDTTANTTNYDWVDWDEDNGKNVQRYYNDNNTIPDVNFNAKVYQSGTILQITRNNNRITTTNNNGGNNNHMYIIQIGSASADYVIGNPTIGEDGKSQDQVVAPAFMIASQLGTVSGADRNVTNASNSALHCRHYIEVTHERVGNTNMRKIFTGWRLPTKQEIKVIANYQNEVNNNGQTISNNNRVITEVLAGRYYATLDGTWCDEITTEEPDNNMYTRCIRTMTADDLKYLNGLMTDQEKMNYLEAY